MRQPSFQFDERDRADQLDVEILDILHGRRGPWPIEREAAEVLRRLQRAKGASRAILIRDLVAATGLSDRQVKEAVRTLVVSFGLPIAGSRTMGGYYIALTAEDIEDAARPLEGEIRALAARVRSLRGKHRVREMLGQLAAELGEDGEAA